MIFKYRKMIIVHTLQKTRDLEWTYTLQLYSRSNSCAAVQLVYMQYVPSTGAGTGSQRGRSVPAFQVLRTCVYGLQVHAEFRALRVLGHEAGSPTA